MQASSLQQDELSDIRQEIARIVGDPDQWLNAPNDQFGGRTPADLIGTDDEQLLRDWTRRVKNGMPT
jgi:hypothetical protein